MFLWFFFIGIVFVSGCGGSWSHSMVILNTWGFDQANQNGWNVLVRNGSALDAVVAAGSECEELQCDHTVGWGGSPDENGETTLDAMIMDGQTLKVGSVAALRNIKNVIGVARAVLEHTKHSMLVGSQATEFALAMGFKKQNLTSQWSLEKFDQWKKSQCQPNFWVQVQPNPEKSCGPYEPITDKNSGNLEKHYNIIDRYHHDTIGVVAIDNKGRMASGTSTNGAIHKIPGRVGDSPIAGAGSYVDQEIGGAAATGDGDIIMRFLPSYQAVENLRHGMSPSKAGQEALRRILKKYPYAQVGIVVTDNRGNFGAACINIKNGFPYTVRQKSKINQKTSKTVSCLSVDDS